MEKRVNELNQGDLEAVVGGVVTIPAMNVNTTQAASMNMSAMRYSTAAGENLAIKRVTAA